MLFEKLNSGLLWDSMNGAEPLSTRYASSGEEIKVYGDGSIAVFSVALEDQALSYDTSLGAINPSAVSGCTRSGIHYAMYWKNCTASWDYGFIQYYMNFDYQNIRGSGSSITDYRRWRADSQFGAVSNVTATRDSPNQITVSGNWQAPGGWSSRTHINVLRSEGVLAKTLP